MIKLVLAFSLSYVEFLVQQLLQNRPYFRGIVKQSESPKFYLSLYIPLEEKSGWLPDNKRDYNMGFSTALLESAEINWNGYHICFEIPQ